MSGPLYNEWDREKAAWLRELMSMGCIEQGEVDERSIKEIGADELAGFQRAHFFAGIGVWEYALRLAGWPAAWPIWTASCPCQPFSAAGRRKGAEDERHLWPWLAALISERKPYVVAGEQVSSADGRAWIDLVRTDMEGQGYAVGVLDTNAAGAGAPHIRNRFYWCAMRTERMAHHGGAGLEEWRSERGDAGGKSTATERNCGTERLGDAESQRWAGGPHDADGRRRECASGLAGAIERLGDATSERCGEARPMRRRSQKWVDLSSITRGHWDGADWVLTRPQRVGDPPGLRPVEPRLIALANGASAGMGRSGHPGFPLAQGEEARTLRLKGYGDAIVATQAAVFLRCVMGEIEALLEAGDE